MPLPAFLLPAIGAGLGALIKRDDDPLKGALIGGGLGFGAGALAPGLLGGAATGGAAGAVPGGGLLSTATLPPTGIGAEGLVSGSLGPTLGVDALSAGAALPPATGIAPGGLVEGALSGATRDQFLGGLAPKTAALSQGILPQGAFETLPSKGPIVQEFLSKGFKDKLTTGLIDAAPTAAASLLQRQPTAQAPAGQLPRGQFVPAQNLFFNFQRRRR